MTPLRNKFTKAARSPIVIIAISLMVLFLLLDLCFPFKPSIRYSTQIEDKNGELIHAFLSADDKWRLYAEAKEFTPLLRQTLLFKEDRYFHFHPGINPLAVARAMIRNVITGRRTSGASTITMQVVRLLRPAPRTYSSKIVEMVRALQLELHYSKEEILQFYFNLVPYGGNIEGIKAASLCYFDKPPMLLSLAEITALTIIPNRPSALKPGQKNEKLRAERDKWLIRFRENGLFDEKTVRDAVAEPMDIVRREIRREAPHLAYRLKKKSNGVPVVRATLVRQKQHTVEVLVRNYVERLKSVNIHNASVVVVDNETMDVVAYIGSADFSNPFDGGQVDGVRAIRSPGSVLKPMLYAMAFDKGLVAPQSVINDVPTNFSGYEPENFDRQFNGPVTVEYALSNSLNIPAVKLLQEMGVKAFIGQLKKEDFKTVKIQEGNLGLSMILGGCGVTLEELTRQFATFANGGEQRSLVFTTDRKQEGRGTSGDSRVLSPEAAYLVTEVLTKITRPDLPVNFDNTFHLPRIAWKTGTSFGKRDAWSIGYNRRYTVGVWVGNFSGEGVPELSGANTATPLLFKIFNALDYNSPKGWYAMPEQISTRKVCSTTGDIPEEFCDNRILEHFIVGVSPQVSCRHRRWIFTDQSAKIAYCTYCLPKDGYVKRSVPNLAPELIAYYEQKGIPYEQIPPHEKGCQRVFNEGGPVITSPNAGSEYYIQPGREQQLLLSCQAAANVREVYWYVNDRLVQSGPPAEQVFVTPPMGKVKISCSDDRGNNQNLWIVVKKI